MKNRATQFVATVIVGVAANLTMGALSGTARAEECLAGPKSAAPHGSHWYYRVDRTTKRNCWYVREVGRKPGQPTTTASTPPDSAAAQPARPPVGATLQPSVANARAEYSSPQESHKLVAAQPATPAARSSSAFDGAQNPDPQAASAQRWPLASRWSEDAGADQSAGNAIADQQIADQQIIAPDNVVVPAMNSSAAAAPPIDRGLNSIWMLLGALAGALALAGGLVGATIKFGNARPTVKRDANGRPDIWGAAISDGRLSNNPPYAIDEQERIELPMNWIRIARERHAAQDQSDEIEQLLARAPRRSA